MGVERLYRQRRSFWPMLLVVLGLVLAACGGGAGKSPKPEPKSYIVSGTVLDDDDNAIAGVTLHVDGDDMDNTTVTPETDGSWQAADLKGEVTITPVHEDGEYEFDPTSATVTKADDEVHFVGTLLPPTTFTVSGTVLDEGDNPITDTTIAFSGLTDTATTDGDGNWDQP